MKALILFGAVLAGLATPAQAIEVLRLSPTDKIVLDGIRSILKQHPEFRVVGEASTGQEALQFLKRTPVDLIVMDLKLQGLTGAETATEILRYDPGARVVMLSGYPDEDSVVGSLKAGARAFVLKDAGEADLIDALRTVARGGTYLSAQVSDGLLGKTLMTKLGVNNVAGLTEAALSAGITHPPMAPHKPWTYGSAERDAKALSDSIFAMCGDPSLLDEGEDPPARSVMHRAARFIGEAYLLLNEPPPLSTVGMCFGEINVSWRAKGRMVRLAFFDHRPTVLTVGSLTEPVGSYQSTSNPTPNQVALRLNSLEPSGGVNLGSTPSLGSLAS